MTVYEKGSLGSGSTDRGVAHLCLDGAASLVDTSALSANRSEVGETLTEWNVA